MAFSASHELVVTICQSRSSSARVCKRTGSSPTIKIDAVKRGLLLDMLLSWSQRKTRIKRMDAEPTWNVCRWRTNLKALENEKSHILPLARQTRSTLLALYSLDSWWS